jgi:hypothetical protein
MNAEDEVKLFSMSAQMAEKALDQVEDHLDLILHRGDGTAADKDESYYPQISEAVRNEARDMSGHYELFYCLEKSIRSLIRDKMNAEVGATWWSTAVPENVRSNVDANIKREQEAGITRRSTDELDYTTFGELGEIVRANWPRFGDVFNSDRAFTRIMSTLNLLRGPIAHCSPLAEDEVTRLRVTLKDWFRLME